MVKSNIASGTQIKITIPVRNSPYRMRSSVAKASLVASGVFIPVANFSFPDNFITKAMPEFRAFSVSESDCNENNYNSVSKTWTGSCVGMKNIVSIKFTSNLDLEPGTTITVEGLVRSSRVALNAPRFVEVMPDPVDLSIEDWIVSTGTVILKIAGGSTTSMKADVPQTIKLEFDMPTQPSSNSTTLTLSASNIAGIASCFSLSTTTQASILQSKLATPTPKLVLAELTQSDCNPASCATFVFSFAVNSEITYMNSNSIHSFYLDGFRGFSGSCSQTDSCGSSDSKRVTLEDGVT
eukprot:751844-Hanusia_phi.AAC.1